MAKIYFVRHQAAGVVFKYPFGDYPSDAQIAAVAKECFNTFGAAHKKTPDEPYWVRVEEVDVLGLLDVPEVAPPSLSVVNEAGVGEITASGVATVTLRETQQYTSEDVGSLNDLFKS